MPEFHAASEIDVSADALYDWHARPEALARLLPPWERIEIRAERGTIHDGDTKHLRLRKLGLAFNWLARHRDHVPGRQFIDEAEGGPFRTWVHTHRFHDLGPDRSRLEDIIRYELPFGWLGRTLLGKTVATDLQRTFAWRHRRTGFDLQRQAAGRYRRQRILIGGASGLVGSALSAYLGTAGHEVWSLVRRPARPEAREVHWDPDGGDLRVADVEGFDAVVHLGGANIAGGRWTKRYKETIRASRVDSTTLLAETLARLRKGPRVFLSASAVGMYGNRGDDPLDENSPPGTGFLPETCLAWEAATDAARAAGIRTVNLRIGVVLALRGGALGTMLTPFRLGVGGPLGDGRQFMSWIALEDLVGMIDFALQDDDLSGPVNATAPHPVRQGDFARTLGHVLRRPAILPAPAFAIRMALGEMGQALLLDGARVMPIAAARAGFPFLFPYLEDALRWELGAYAGSPGPGARKQNGTGASR